MGKCKRTCISCNAKISKKNINTILIGHKDHPEVEGTIGRYITDSNSEIILVENESDVEKLKFDENEEIAYVTQTTLSIDDTKNIIDAIKKKYQNVIEPARGDICYATTNRQLAIKSIASKCDLIYVIGANNSSNSLRLVEVGKRSGCDETHLISDISEVNWRLVEKKQKIGLTAGASAPDILIQEFINELNQLYNVEIKKISVADENITFKIPRELSE